MTMTSEGVVVVPGWLAEVLHVVLAVARDEHLDLPGRPAMLVRGHAETALSAVPAGVRKAAGV